MRPASAKQIEAGLAVLRVVTGIVFAVHGYQKFFMMGLDGTAGFFGSLGMPMPGIAAPLVATLELAGGIALALGLFTRPLALLLVSDMLGAIALVHAKNGFFVPKGIEFVMTLGTVALALALAGPGSPSLDRMLSGRSPGPR
ncbi:MAG: DoxX family protein [Gemmatimonadaceae bacterium]